MPVPDYEGFRDDVWGSAARCAVEVEGKKVREEIFSWKE